MPIDATAAYDDGNIFARILRGELPSKTVYEDDFALAFHDINPQAPVHILVSAKAPDAEIAGFVRAVGHVAREQGLVEPGYRMLANIGVHGHQEVPHLHIHLFGGRQFREMVPR
jgi:diadenosine tetraphosphate (Ap4A) HIT family hydrolase